jgi:hypothetical protein
MKLSMRLILCFALGLVPLSGGAWLWVAKTGATRQQTAANIQHIRNEGLVRDMHRLAIETAKEKGKNEAILPPMVEVPGIQRSLEELLRDYGLLRVKVTDKETTVSGPNADIKTWYKVEIVETLHHQSEMIGSEPLPDEAPTRLLPLLPSESLLVVYGGVVTVDGVKVIRRVSTNANHFIPKEEYLIVGYLDYGGKLIRPVSGRAGVFRINNTHLKSFGQEEEQLVREIEEIYGNDLDNLRSNLQFRLRQNK